MICTETGRVIYDEKLHPFNLRSRIRIATGISKPQLPSSISVKMGELCAEYLVNYDGSNVDDYGFILGFLEGLALGTRGKDISATIEDILFQMVTTAYAGTVYGPLDYPE